VSHNAIPVEKFVGLQNNEVLDSLRGELGIQGSYPVLINISRLTPGKGQELLVAMMPFIIQRWPEAKLLLVGEGEHRAQLQRAIRDVGLEQSVLMLGRLGDITAPLAISDVFVFSSFFEGFPLTVLEAMAAGKPVVAIELPPLRELQNEGTGIRLVEQRNAKMLAEAVSEIVEDREQAQAIGQSGQRIVSECYSMANSIKRLEAVYTSVLDGGA